MSLRPLRAALEAWRPGRIAALDPLHAIVAAWPAIVGEHVAANSAPLEFSGAALIVATRSSAWSQQLQFLSLAILEGIQALPEGKPVTRLTFRSGAMRGPATRRRAAPPDLPRGAQVARGPDPEPAIDAVDALERLRRRLGRLRAKAGIVCRGCGLALGSNPGRDRCGPCLGRAESERLVAAQRALYMTPWLGYTETREQVRDLAPAEFERARRALLHRWWLVLDRARRAKAVSGSGFERQVASSYVLLQSRLPPDRIGPAIVRNVLGPELASLLWGTAEDLSNTSGR